MSKFYVINTLLALLAFVLSSNAIILDDTNLADLCRCNPKNTTYFRFGFPEVTGINPFSFKGLTNVTSLSFGMNFNGRISSIDPLTFSGLTSLQFLDLSNNKISWVHFGAFRGLTSLKSLILHGNKISFIDPLLFRELQALEFLMLGSNKIDFLFKNQFNGLTKLKNLGLQFNNLSSIDPEVFKGLNSLEYLNLLGCGISDIKLVEAIKSNVPATTKVMLQGNPVCDKYPELKLECSY